MSVKNWGKLVIMNPFKPIIHRSQFKKPPENRSLINFSPTKNDEELIIYRIVSIRAKIMIKLTSQKCQLESVRLYGQSGMFFCF